MWQHVQISRLITFKLSAITLSTPGCRTDYLMLPRDNYSSIILTRLEMCPNLPWWCKEIKNLFFQWKVPCQPQFQTEPGRKNIKTFTVGMARHLILWIHDSIIHVWTGLKNDPTPQFSITFGLLLLPYRLKMQQAGLSRILQQYQCACKCTYTAQETMTCSLNKSTKASKSHWYTETTQVNASPYTFMQGA